MADYVDGEMYGVVREGVLCGEGEASCMMWREGEVVLYGDSGVLL